jgi:hypothetical protein
MAGVFRGFAQLHQASAKYWLKLDNGLVTTYPCEFINYQVIRQYIASESFLINSE